MNTVCVLSFPGNPRPAPRYQRTATGREYMPSWYVAEKEAMGGAMLLTRGKHRPGRDQRFSLVVTFVRENGYRVDGDNLEKTVFDAGTGILWIDDSQIVKCAWEKQVDRANPRTEIRVYTL